MHIADASYAADDLVFQHTQEFRLQQRGKFADFIEKQRAAVGRLEQALLHLLGVGERAFFVAEEFGFHQRLGNGGTVDGDERLLLARTFVVDGFGDEVLAGSAFALNQNRGGLAGRNLADEVHELGHLGRDAHHVGITGSAAHLAAQRLDFGAQTGGLKRVLDGHVQLVEIDRLADEVVSP